ncbi:MAG: GTPase HflX [Deltaproteobacteria bacterium]|nr:GTPase HflX [Deltaproteobacteria bacterium]
MSDIFGNISGLKPSQIKALSNLKKRRLPPNDLITTAIASSLCILSEEIGREIGVLCDRKGHILKIIVGSNLTLDIPELAWKERGRLSGIRLIHSHPNPDALRPDDITNLLINRLDCVTVVFRNRYSGNIMLQYAFMDTYEKAWKSDITQYSDVKLNLRELIFDLEEKLGSTEKVRKVYKSNQAVCVVCADSRDRAERRSEELSELAATAGVEVEDVIIQIRKRNDPSFLVGSGKLKEILTQARRLDVDMLIFDPELTPVQAKNISDATELKILDRTLLILDIFAVRAASREGKIQVELAQLKYSLPRLVGKNNMLSRLMGGGIGGRGPGETKLEIDRRRAQERILYLEKQIKQISAQRALRRGKRNSSNIPVVAIVGYTNAGKSTLLKSITKADVLCEDKLFATLDPRTRRVRFPENLELILTDTVGFIEDLPEDLQKAFKATLEELENSDLLIHLIDISDPRHIFHMGEVEKILKEMGLSDKPFVNVFNKIDKTDIYPENNTGNFFISALDKRTMEPLISFVADFFLVPSVIPEYSESVE